MIHGYELNGYHIIIDVYSGSVHSVDAVAYDVIMQYENTPREDIVKSVSAAHGVAEAEVEACLRDVEQ